MLVFDTNILIELEVGNEKVASFLKKLYKQHLDEPCITAPTYSEFLYGYLQRSSKKQQKAIDILGVYTLLNTSKKSSMLLAQMKYDLEKKGKIIPLADLIIASIVVDNQATLITLDQHFQQVPGLQSIIVEN